MNTDTRFQKVEYSQTFNRLCREFNLRHKKVFDLGCGYGEYLSLFGEGSVGVNANEKEVGEALSRGLSVVRGNIEELPILPVNETFDIIWANNFFEHLLSPHEFLMHLRRFTAKSTKLILGVPVIPKTASLLHFVKFRGSLASNHINFFTKDTLYLTVERAGWKVEAIRPFITSVTWIDALFSAFMPHVYVIASPISDFVYPPKKLMEWQGEKYYDHLLTITKQK